MTTLNTIIEEEKNGVVYEEAVDFAESAKVLHISDVEKLLTTAMQRAYEQALEDVIQKATLKENPIEDNGELIDGSYYVIYKGYLDQLKK